MKLAAALSRVLPSPVSLPNPEGPPCPLCLGTLEGGGEEPLTKRFVDMAVEATRIRGYQLQGGFVACHLNLISGHQTRCYFPVVSPSVRLQVKECAGGQIANWFLSA